jgi:hypothetical protein
LNTILYVLFTGYRSCDVPKGESFAKCSRAHDRLGEWSRNAVLEKIKRRFLELAQLHGAINWERASVDGSFSPRESCGKDVDHGYKGKGSTIHLLVDGEGMPLAETTTAANGSEGDQVIKLINSVIRSTVVREEQNHAPKNCKAIRPMIRKS